ncbi:MAG: T9SS type B sorting domain-containing protein [Bacteroidetes bacterium]|nr:T9SS type B sorting domain-containing protein [Bacteroidota bacterium]
MKNSVLHIMHNVIYLVLLLITTTGYSQSLADGTIVSAGSRIKYGVTGLEGSVFQWTLYGPNNNQILSTSTTDSLEIDYPCEPGEYTLQVQEFTEFDCNGAPVSATIDVEPLEVTFEDNEIGLCFGDHRIMSPVIRFDNNKPLSYEWIQVGQNDQIGDNIDLEVSNNDTLDQLRTDRLAFRAVYERPGVRCIESDTAMVMKYPLNRINMEDQIKICDKDPRYLYPGDYAIYDWSTGDMSDQIQVDAITKKDSSRTIWVDVTDFYGCEYSDTIVILACNVMEILENIPNAFSPENEKGGWVIEELEQFPGARLEIFDRWGRMVFSTNDATSDFWDGTYKGKLLPADSYYYVIDLNTPDQEEPVAGSVSLVY